VPTYEYRCKSCGHEFEQFQTFAEDTLVKCPSCGKDTLVRLIGGAGLSFKGSGFYITDYKKSGASPSSVAGEKKDSKGETKESSGEKKESKGETKGEAKPESKKAEPKAEPKKESKKSDTKSE
jgi:putative FmdB family regulatory protein